ncbi:MAG: tripartite tricarboxylate transporter TctB family protein [Rhodovibrio sp.]|nr:tripartite tricarboxylate transporter TctB family protein [Rhodovibrio sp.]
MTVRTAELAMTLLLAAFSVYLMIKSTELPIGWIKGEGPGGGAWPFWLSGLMLVCCAATLVRWWRGTTEVSRTAEEFMTASTRKIILPTVISLFALLGIASWLGVYIAVMLFLFFYLRFMGRHSWTATGGIAVAAPVLLFFFFEGALRIILPKGISQPLFDPLYTIIY